MGVMLPQISDMAAMKALKLRPKEAGTLLLGIFAEMAFQRGLVHGDPHPGATICCSSARAAVQPGALIATTELRISPTAGNILVRPKAEKEGACSLCLLQNCWRQRQSVNCDLQNMVMYSIHFVA